MFDWYGTICHVNWDQYQECYKMFLQLWFYRFVLPQTILWAIEFSYNFKQSLCSIHFFLDGISQNKILNCLKLCEFSSILLLTSWLNNMSMKEKPVHLATNGCMGVMMTENCRPNTNVGKPPDVSWLGSLYC